MILTERDFDLLRYLAEQGVATSRQLVQRYFPSHTAFRKRMQALMGADLVESIPLTRLKEFSQPSYFQTSLDLLGASRVNAGKYRVYRLGERFKKKWPGTLKLSGVNMWRHQLLVNELRFIFEKKFPDAQFLNDPQILEEWRLWDKWKSGIYNDTPVPDMTIRTGNLCIAVEVERNLKSESNYFSRFLEYEKSDYTHILYYCESENVFRKVSKLATHYEWMAFARFGSIENVYRIIGGWTSVDKFLAEFSWKNERRL